MMKTLKMSQLQKSDVQYPRNEKDVGYSIESKECEDF